MRYLHAFAAVAVLLSGACINLPEIEQVPEEPDAGDPRAEVPDASTWTPDASVADSGTLDAGHPELALELVTPRAVTYTRGSVQLGVEVEGSTPEKLELLVNGSPLAIMVAPYAYAWDTSSVAEGEHVLRARATLGGRTFLSSERVIVVDRTSPRVLSRVPAPGSQGISVRETIRATFDEPLDVATVSGESIQLRAGTSAVAHVATLSEDGKTLTVTLDARLEVPTTLSSVLTHGLTDLAGNSLEFPQEPWSWGLPESFMLGSPLRANSGATAVTAPVIRQDGNANLVVAWSEEDGTSQSVYVRRWEDGAWKAMGGALSARSEVDTPVSAAALELNDEGDPTVAWVEEEEGTVRTVHVRQWDGQDWKALGTGLSGTATKRVAFVAPALRVDGQGFPVVAGSDFDAGTSTYKAFVQRWNGSNWFPVGEGFSLGTQQPLRPDLVLDSQGNPMVVFVEFLSGVQKVHVRWRQGGTWTPVGAPFEITYNERRLSQVVLRLNRDNKPVLSWVEESISPRVDAAIFVRRWDGDSWELLGAPLSARAGATPVRTHDLQLDAQGNPTVAWSEFDGTGVTDVFVQQWDGLDWKPVGGAISAVPGATAVWTPVLSLGSAGTPTIAWEESDGTTSGGYVLQYNR